MYKGKETKQWDDSVIQKSTSDQSCDVYGLFTKFLWKKLVVNSDKITERMKSERKAERNYQQSNLFFGNFLKTYQMTQYPRKNGRQTHSNSGRS